MFWSIRNNFSRRFVSSAGEATKNEFAPDPEVGDGSSGNTLCAWDDTGTVLFG